MKMSENFWDLVLSPESGTDDVISELNFEVAKGNLEVEVMLEKYGEEYFMKCMSLAKNVIISLEREAE